MSRTRAALSTLAALAAPHARAVEKYQKEVANYQHDVKRQAREFTSCWKRTEEEIQREHAALYASQRSAWAAVASLAPIWEAKDTCEMHQHNPSKPVTSLSGYTYCKCAVCVAVNNAYEWDKEVRKGVWYDSNWCGCAKCEPISPPEPPPAAPDLPSVADCHGEEGADY